MQEPEAAISVIGIPAGGRIIDLNNLCTLPYPHTVFSTFSPGTGSGAWNFVYGRTFPFSYGPIASPSDVGNYMLGLASHQYTPCMKETF